MDGSCWECEVKEGGGGDVREVMVRLSAITGTIISFVDL